MLIAEKVSLWWQTNRGHSLFTIEDLSFEIGSSQAPIWLNAPSAGGKSTLLRALAGLTEHWGAHRRALHIAGEILLKETRIADLARNGAVGYAPQQHLFLEHESTFENIFLPFTGGLSGRAPLDRDVIEAATFLNLSNVLYQPVHSLSGGQRDRVGFLRALFVAQRLLILDESFGSSDSKVRARMFNLCKNWLKEGDRLLIFTSHDPSDAENLDAVTRHLLQPTEDSKEWKLL
jgi:ABC-type nitrate/sulfonate/bicarbonate transport system ATPase subunit